MKLLGMEHEAVQQAWNLARQRSDRGNSVFTSACSRATDSAAVGGSVASSNTPSTSNLSADASSVRSAASGRSAASVEASQELSETREDRGV